MGKMGWSAEKGLGRKEDGVRKCVKYRVKKDNAGIGASKKDDSQTWRAATGVFNSVLSKLKPVSASKKGVKADTSVSKASKSSATLEIKRYSARNQLYSKFHKSKDISSYSKADLRAILGGDGVSSASPLESAKTPPTGKDMASYFADKKRRRAFTEETQQDIYRALDARGTKHRRGLGAK